MASLRQLATEYINALNKPFDTMLYERVKALIIHERAQEIRRSVQKHGIDLEHLQRYKVKLIKTDASDSYGIDSGKIVLRSENKIAILVRIQNDSPFTYVGAVNNDYPYIFSPSYGIGALQSLEFVKRINAYDFRNGYIYVYSTNPNIEYIHVEASFANPQLIDNSDNHNPAIAYNDDMEFLISEDMIQTIKIKLLSGELSVNVSDKEIDITDDDNR